MAATDLCHEQYDAPAALRVPLFHTRFSCYRSRRRLEMHCSVSFGETDIRIIFAVRIGFLVFHSLVRDLG